VSLLLLAASTLAAAQSAPLAPGAMQVVCAPAAAGQRLMGVLAGPIPLLPLARNPAAVLLALPGDPEAAAAAGIDLAGPMRFRRGGADGDRAQVRLADPAAGARALTALGLSPTDAPTSAASSAWALGGGWSARVVGADLVVSRDGAAPAPRAAAPLLSDRRDEPGCRVTARVDGEMGGELGAFLPASTDRPIVLRMEPPQAPPSTLSRTLGAPVPGTSVAPPFVVVTIGVPLLDLAADLAARPGSALPVSPEDLDELSRMLRIEAGVTLAAWLEPGGLSYAASVPISGGRGQDLPTRSLTRRLKRRLAKEPGLVVYRRGRTALRIEPRGKAPIELVVQPDRIVVGSATRAVTESAQGVGQPWVGPELAALAARAPIVLETRMDQTRALHAPPGALRLGLRSDGPRVELLIDGADHGGMVQQLMFLAGMAQRLRRPDGAPTR